MYRKTHRIRKAGVAALVAATALSGLVAIAPSASAAPITGPQLDMDEVTSTNIGLGKTNQAAGNLTITNTVAADTLTAGDQILLTLNDSDGTTCVATDTLQFAAVPTVTVTGTATIVPTIESSDAPCLAASVEEQLRLNVIAGGTLSAITISGITYNVGATSALGAVALAGSIDAVAFADAAASNAFITSAILTANTPPKGAALAAGGTQAISPLVIAEQTTTSADLDLCITLAGTNAMNLPLVQPTVAVSAGSDTATITAVDATRLFLDVTASTPTATASTFTISGIVLDTDANGFTTAILNGVGATAGECVTDVGAALSVSTDVGFVGTVRRFGGSDRFTTAQMLFEDQFSCNDTAIIARGDNFPDALAASYLAGFASTGILLTETNSIPAATINALRNEGVENVYLMGGTTAISAAVETQLDGIAVSAGNGCDAPTAGQTLTITRLGGATRFDTASLAAEFPGLSNAGLLDTNNDGDCTDNARTAIVASGINFPDALAAGPLAYAGNPHGACGHAEEIPLLLSGTTSVPSQTLDSLGNLGIVNVIVVGGTSAVSAAAEAQLITAGYNVRRIAGTTRQGTAVALGTAMINEWGFHDDEISLSRGNDFADALTGGPWSGECDGPSACHQIILLAGTDGTSLSAETTAMLAGWAPFGDVVDTFDILGGTAAVPVAVVQAALDAASQQ